MKALQVAPNNWQIKTLTMFILLLFSLGFASCSSDDDATTTEDTAAAPTFDGVWKGFKCNLENTTADGTKWYEQSILTIDAANGTFTYSFLSSQDAECQGAWYSGNATGTFVAGGTGTDAVSGLDYVELDLDLPSFTHTPLNAEGVDMFNTDDGGNGRCGKTDWSLGVEATCVDWAGMQIYSAYSLDATTGILYLARVNDGTNDGNSAALRQTEFDTTDYFME